MGWASVGLEIEPSRELMFKSNTEKLYASLVTRDKIVELARELGIQNFQVHEAEGEDKAFAYLCRNKTRILGLYLDTAPELDFLCKRFPNISDFQATRQKGGLEIKSTQEGLIDMESADQKWFSFLHKCVYTLNREIARISRSLYIPVDREWGWSFTQTFIKGSAPQTSDQKRVKKRDYFLL